MTAAVVRHEVQLTRIGQGLQRPECVVTTAAGDIYTSDRRGGVAHIRPDGSHTLYLGTSAELPDGISPNGIALEADGSFLIAHLGPAHGGVFRLGRDGTLQPIITELDGYPLPPTNFVTRDRWGRLWITVSTRVRPRDADYRRDACSGFIVLDDGTRARVVADDLGYVNECEISSDGRWLYVNETFPRRLSRFPIRGGAELGRREVVAEFGPGEFPDGLALDESGSIWVACVVGNKILRVDPAGDVSIWIDAGIPEQVMAVERAYVAGTMGSKHVYELAGSPLGHCSSITFGGPGRRTAYVGSLLNDHIISFAAPVAGTKPPHWFSRA